MLVDGILKEVPFIKIVYAIFKIGKGVYERNLINQTLAFIQQCNKNTISPEKLNDYKEKCKNNSKWATQELSRVLILLNTHIDYIQSQVLGCFFNSYICGNITWDMFCELSEANKRMFASDYKVLFNLFQGRKNSENELYKFDRMASIGLLENVNNRGASYTYGNADDFTISSFGVHFCQHSIKLVKSMDD